LPAPAWIVVDFAAGRDAPEGLPAGGFLLAGGLFAGFLPGCLAAGFGVDFCAICSIIKQSPKENVQSRKFKAAGRERG
jgi:hypothetical protein